MSRSTPCGSGRRSMSKASGLNRKRRPTLRLYSGTRFPLGTPFGKRVPFFRGAFVMQSALALFLVRALKPKQPLLAVKPAGISIKRPVGRHHAMARHDNRNGITCNRSPHRTRRHNGCLVSRYTMSSGNTLGDLAIRSDLATRNRKQLKPNLTLKRRADHMQRRRKPRFLPCKISIQPSPRTLKHRRGGAICRTHRRHAANTGNRVGAFNMFGVFPEKRRAKVLLSLKPKPRQTAAISGKQDFAQRRGKRRRDHQRLLSKLRNIIPRIVQTTPIDPKVTQGSRREAPQLQHDPKVPAGSRRSAPQLPAAPHSPQRQQAQSAEAAAGTRTRNSHVPSHQPSGPSQQRPHRRPLAAESPQAGAGLSFQNTPQTSVAPCPRLRRSRTRRHTWSRTF